MKFVYTDLKKKNFKVEKVCFCFFWIAITGEWIHGLLVS